MRKARLVKIAVTGSVLGQQELGREEKGSWPEKAQG